MHLARPACRSAGRRFWPAGSTWGWPAHRWLALAVGIVVGCLELGLLAGDHDFWRAVAAVAPSRLWFSLAELIFFALCMAGYLWLAGRSVRRPKAAATLAVLARST